MCPPDRLSFFINATKHDGNSKPQLFLCIKDRPHCMGNQDISLNRKLTVESKIVRVETRSVQQETLGSLFSPFSRSGAMAFKFPQRAFAPELGKVCKKFVCF